MDRLPVPFVTFEQSVLPMFSANDDDHPKRTASCVLVHYRSRPFIVTAKHNLLNNPVAIHVGRGGSTLIPLPIEAFFTSHAPDPLDIAVVPLRREQESMLQEHRLVFIREPRFDLDVDAKQKAAVGNDYVVFGWPESQSQSRIDRPARNIKQSSFSLQTGAATAESAVRAGIDLASHLLLDFDPAQVTVQGKRHNPPRPHGLSGAAAFHVVGHDPRLAGILTAFRRVPPRVMIAVRMREVVAILEHVVSYS